MEVQHDGGNLRLGALPAATANPDTTLRSLDAIHLATVDAMFGTRLTAFVTHDERLLTAAAAAGMPTAAPGR